MLDDPEDLEELEAERDDVANVSVPLTITILVVTFYIVVGGVMFHFFEGWQLIESAYFCFVTLATIGKR